METAGTNEPLGRWGGRPALEITMFMRALMLTPYIAIASSLVLAATIAVVCYSQRALPGVGNTA